MNTLFTSRKVLQSRSLCTSLMDASLVMQSLKKHMTPPGKLLTH